MTARRWLAFFALLVGLALAVVLQRSREHGAGNRDSARQLATGAANASSAIDESLSPPSANASPGSHEDRAELSRQLQFRMTCARVASQSREMDRQLKDPNSWINNDEAARSLNPKDLQYLQDRLAEWESNREPCKRLGTSIDDGSIYQLALRAANAGDGDAAACYIMTRWTVPQDPTFKGPRISHSTQGILPRFISEYSTNARRLLDEGLQRGDWRMVSLLDIAINDRQGQLIGGLRRFDSPDEEYVNLRLMQLGTRGEKTGVIARRVEFALQNVPANRVAVANARAQSMYDASFADKGPYEWGFGGCR